jgi:uncharacterized membrane protein
MAIDLMGYPKYKNALERYQRAKSELSNSLMIFLNPSPSKVELVSAMQQLNNFQVLYGKNKLLESAYQRIENNLRNMLLLGIGSNNSDFIDEEFLGIASSIESEEIQISSKLLFARKQRTSKDYESYVILLEELMFHYPMNREVLLRYEWAINRLKRQQTRLEKRKRQDEKVKHYTFQSTIWFIVSIVYALTFLLISVYVIYRSIFENDLLTRLVGLLSILPTLATKLVYDQSIRASDRAQAIHKEVSDDEDQIIKEDAEFEDFVRRQIYTGSKKKKSN